MILKLRLWGDKTFEEFLSRIHSCGCATTTFLLTMLFKRGLWLDRTNLNGPCEISRNTWVFDDNISDKIHPYYCCGATEMLRSFQGVEVCWMEDREHEKLGSWHWYLILERQA